MSGHSKWAQIKHKKATTDAKRGNLFATLARAITIAAKDGADPEMNARLRLAIERARGYNMPADNIERAALRAASSKDATELVNVLYEAYAPGGSALLVEGITDNKNRTAAEIKHLLAEHGGKFAESGSVVWMFRRRGVLFLPDSANRNLESEDTQLVLIDAGAEDFIKDSEGLYVYTEPEKRLQVGERITQRGFAIGEVADVYVATTPVLLPDGPEMDRLVKLVEALEENEDVENVWSNTRL